MKDSKTAKNAGFFGRRQIIPAVWMVVWVAVAGLLVAGCSSDPASSVGAGLIGAQIDSTFVSLEIVAMDAFSGLRVDNPDISIPEQQTLYLGYEGDTRTSFLVNFDFTDTSGTEFPDDLYTLENIRTVKFSLTKLLVYGPEGIEEEEKGTAAETPQDLKFWITEIAAPFDPEDYKGYPSVEPDPVGPYLTQEPGIAVPRGNEIILTMYADDLMRWIDAGEKVGFLVRLSDDTPEGLVGFASRDLTQVSQVPDLAVGTIVAPEILVDFNDTTFVNQIIPTEDTTVFSGVTPAPTTIDDAADSFVLRTGLRSYPAFRFDLSNIPENVLINRAVLTVVNDTLTSSGPAFSVRVSEITAAFVDDPYGTLSDTTMSVDMLGDGSQVYPLTFRSNLLTGVDTVIEFDITTGIRRAVNLVNDEPRGFVLSGVDDRSAFPIFSGPPDITSPDFYFRQMVFFGLQDPDNAPRLKVWYSVVNDLSGGGQ